MSKRIQQKAFRIDKIYHKKMWAELCQLLSDNYCVASQSDQSIVLNCKPRGKIHTDIQVIVEFIPHPASYPFVVEGWQLINGSWSSEEGRRRCYTLGEVILDVDQIQESLVFMKDYRGKKE